MNIDCQYLNKCRRANTEFCMKCENNKCEDYFKEKEDDYEEGDEDDYDLYDDEDEEINELSKKIARYENFKDCNKNINSAKEFIKEYFPEILEEWEDFAVDKIINNAINYLENPEEMEDYYMNDYGHTVSKNKEEEYARKIAEHPEFPKYMQNQSTREYFIRKYFPDIYEEINKSSSLYEISNLSKGIYHAEIKNAKK